MTIGTKLYTMFKGQLAGEDEFGNRYYRERCAKKGARQKRWVLYKGSPEASKVPAEWHIWLHYTSNEIPDSKNSKKYFWEKSHQPNMSGTSGAYVPPGHVFRGGERYEVESDYQAWKP